MQEIVDFIKNDYFILILVCLNILLIIGYIINVVKTSKIKKKYDKFIRKLGNSTSIEEDLKKYMEDVQNLKQENQRLANYCKNLDNEIDNCIQKVGIVRYSAFKDTGSDLSFAIAMLDENNDGILLNGIYSREMSNIYGKSIKNGKSEYTLSKEEEEAIYRAINNEK